MDQTSIQGFYAVAESLPDPLLLVDVEGRFFAANRAACRLMDCTHNDLLQRGLADVTVQSSADIRAYLGRCSRSRSLTPGSLQLRHANGEYRTVRADGGRYGEPQTGRAAVIMLRLTQHERAILRFTTLESRLQELSTEIRERLRAEQRERDLRQWLQGILSSIGEAVLCVDLSGHVTFMNPVAEQLTGWKSQDALQRPISDVIQLLNQHNREADFDLVGRSLASGTSQPIVQCCLQSRTGTLHDVEQQAAPIRDSDDTLVGSVLVVRDIQARRNRDRRTAAEHGIARALMTPASFEEASEEILEAIQSGFGAAMVGLWLPKKNGRRLSCQKMRSAGSGSSITDFLGATRSLTLEPGQGLPGLVWQQRLPYWIDDVREEAAFLRKAAARQCGFRTGMAFPILLGETVYGVVEVYFDRPLRADQFWIDSMVAIGSDIAQFIARVRSDRELRRADLRRKAILDSALDCLITADDEGRILEFNPAAEETFGYRRDEVIGRDLATTIVPPAIREQHNAGFQRFAKTGESRILDTRLEVSAQRADGTEFPCELTITCTEIENEGRLFTAFLRDISSRRTGEEAQARLAAIINSSDDSIVGKTIDGTVISWNAGAERLYGYSAAEAVGQHISFVVPPAHRDELKRLNERIIRGERIAHFHTRRQHKDGSQLDVSLSLSPVVDAQGKIIGISSIARDISLQVQTETSLKAAMAEAREASKLKSQFLASVSHELRTPMNAIIGMTELALSESLPQSVRDFLATSRESSAYLLSLLNDLLDFSKIEAGKFRLESSPFRLRSAIDRSLKTFALQAHDQGIDLTQVVEPNVPDTVIGDEQRLRQVITNLVSNALKFTEHGEVRVRCSLEHRDSTGARLRFTVTDTGIGIAKDQQSHLFEPFAQLDAKLSRRAAGTGLGLAISAELVRHMHGRLWVESEPDAGAVFQFTADFLLPDGTPDRDEDRITLHAVKVLVVQPSDATADTVCEMLTAAGARPSRVADAAAALTHLDSVSRSEQRFSAVIVDAAFLVDDPQLLKTFLSDRFAVSALVILTSPAHGRLAQSAKNAHAATTILDKPVLEDDLLKAVRCGMQGEGFQPETRQQPVVPAPLQSPGRKVLVAEDTPANQKLLTAILTRAGHDIQIVNDGSLAVAAAREERFDIILMDLQMPNMDGMEATRQIRTMEENSGRHTPIVALTAHAVQGFSEDCLSAGMDSYLTKPIDRQQLLEAIARLTAEPHPDRHPAN